MQSVVSYPTFSPSRSLHRWFDGFCRDYGRSHAVGFTRSKPCVPDKTIVHPPVDSVAKAC